MIHKIARIVVLLTLLTAVLESQAQTISMPGVVMDHRGHTITGALVVLENTNIMTLTNTDGEYLLTADQKYRGSNVIVSYTGFLSDTLRFGPAPHYAQLKVKEQMRIASQILNTQMRGAGESEVDVPIAISIIGSDRQENFNLNQIDQISRQAPGLFCLAPSSDWGMFGIRGVGTEGVYAFERARISIYRDGVAMTNPRLNVVELFDMDRVEVVKGPQSTLFGKGSEFGAVRYISNQPIKEKEMRAGAGYGMHGQRNADFMINTPFAGNKFANRTALHYDYHNGYVHNTMGEDVNGKNAMAIKEAISFFPKSRTVHTLTLNYEYDAEPTTGYKTNRVPTPGGSSSPFTAVALTGSGMGQYIRRHVYSAQLNTEINHVNGIGFSNNLAFVGFDSKNGFDLDGSYLNLINTRYHSKGKSISDEARLSWNNGRNLNGFIGISASYDEYNIYSRHYGDFHIFSGLVVSEKLKDRFSELPSRIALGLGEIVRSQAEMIKASADPATQTMIDVAVNGLNAGLANTVQTKLKNRMAGWYASSTWQQTPDFYSDIRTAIRESVSEELGYLVEDPNVAPLIDILLNGNDLETYMDGLTGVMDSQLGEIKSMSGVPLQQFLQEDERHTNEMYEGDVFTDMTWKIWKELYLTAGIRGTYEHQKSGYSSHSDQLPIIGNIMFHPTENGQMVTEQDSYLSWAGRMVLSCKVDSTHNLFFSISKGRSPADLHFEQHPDSIVNLRPERIFNYELGFKGKSKWGHFFYYAAVFYYDWSQFQSYVSYYDNESKLHLYQDDKGKARGLGFDGQLLYTFYQRENNESLSSFLNIALCDGKMSEKNTDGMRQQLAGKKFALSPVANVDFGINWNMRLGIGNIHFYPAMAFTSKYYFDAENSKDLRQDGYWIANANIGYSWKSSNKKTYYYVSLYGKNLMNTKYLISAGNGGSWLGFPTYVSGAPLTAGFNFRMSIK